MRTVGLKKFLIYKSHVFPEVRKPIRSVTDYLLQINPSWDLMKSKKVSQLLDEEEKKKLKYQKDQMNETINLQLRKYYEKYILPFDQCPDYNLLVFEYALKKMEYLKARDLKVQEQEPYYLPKKEITYLTRQLKINSNSGPVFGIQTKTSDNINGLFDYETGQNILSSAEYLAKQQKIHQSKGQQQKYPSQQQAPMQEERIFTLEQEKLLYKIYKHMYPSQKHFIYQKFNELYQQFLMKSEVISKFLLQEIIYHVKPFISLSPLQLYQSKHHLLNMKQSEDFLLKNVQQRDKVNLQFVKLLQQRKKQNEFIQSKYQVNHTEIYSQYRKQYHKLQKTHSFYSILKN